MLCSCCNCWLLCQLLACVSKFAKLKVRQNGKHPGSWFKVDNEYLVWRTVVQIVPAAMFRSIFLCCPLFFFIFILSCWCVLFTSHTVKFCVTPDSKGTTKASGVLYIQIWAIHPLYCLCNNVHRKSNQSLSQEVIQTVNQLLLGHESICRLENS